MWLETETFGDEAVGARHPNVEQLGVARMQMKAALVLLDEWSFSAAAAMLDLAIHQLDRELAGRSG